MKEINNLLERFYKSLLGSERTKEAVSDVIKEATGATIGREKISYKEGVLKIEASPVVKNEISFKEKEILGALMQKHSIKVSRIIYL